VFHRLGCQRLGDWNGNPARGWIEGAWTLKRNGKYYLTYAAAGTENRTYAMGCAVSKSPLGPFVPQKNNPASDKSLDLVDRVPCNAWEIVSID